MKFPRWLPYAGIVAFHVTLFVIARIWLAPLYQKRYQSERAATMMQWISVRDRIVHENERLHELMVRDSLRDVIHKSPGVYIEALSDTVDVLASQRGSRERMEKTSLRTIVMQEAGSAPRASITVVGVPARYGGHPAVRPGFGRRMFFFGTTDGQPYCIVAVDRVAPSQPQIGSLFLRDGALGPCAFWARYGTPGPQIQAWLNAGGAHFAGSDDELGTLGNSDAINLREQRFLLPLAGQACLSGRDDVCASAVADPARIYGQVDPATRWSEWDRRLAPGERAFLTRLEREFGAERFERFWTSDRSFEAAFGHAFGVELGAWVRTSLEPYGRISRGARLGADSILLTMLLLGICVGLALMTAQRRRV